MKPYQLGNGFNLYSVPGLYAESEEKNKKINVFYKYIDIYLQSYTLFRL